MDTQVAGDSLLGSLVGGRYRVRGRLTHAPTLVYTATDERLGRTVAVTFAPPPSGPGDPMASGLVEHAHRMARLTHPNVVATYDQGVHQGLPYLVMEHVAGRNLADVLASRRRLNHDEALAIIEQVLAGLASAHRAGLVHGDIKPENIHVIESPSGGSGNLVDAVAKVGEFGLSRALQIGPGQGEGWTADAAYVAPELVTTGHADQRSDVYSTGILLFEMLTGRAPYHTGTPAEIAWQHVDHTVPPPSQHAPGVPAGLDELVARATRREPDERPSDAGALLAEVRAVRQRPAAPRPAADSTVIIPAVPGSERPTWARLPAPGAGRLQPGGRVGAAYGGVPGGRLATDPAAAARQRTVLLAVGAAIGLLLLVGGWWFGFGRFMPAPELVGMPKDEAVAQAEELGLRVAFAQPRHSEQVAEDIVLAQEPQGRVARGGTITLTLSLGSEIVTVPDVIGAEAQVAERRLADIGLVVHQGEPGFSNTVPQGRVIAIEPEVGTEVRPGDDVVIIVSKGRAPVEVPHVIGLHVNDASNQLQQLGLQVEVVKVDSERPGDEVINQDPGVGAGLEPGDAVRLEISDGPSTVPVPDVTGERCNRAERTLREAGFDVFRMGDGRVHVQNPSPGTGLPPGSQVQILCG